MENETPSLPKCCLVHWKGWIITILVPVYGILVVTFGDRIVNRLVYINVVLFVGLTFELVPVGVIGLLPIGFYPLMNVLVSEDCCTAYFHPVIAEFILGMIVLSCLEGTKFHQREAVVFVRIFGPNVRRLHLVVVFMTTILSICLPHSIAAAIMCFLTRDILANLEKLGVFQRYTEETREMGAADQLPTKPTLGFYLSIGYVASLASACTLSNTPSNLIVRAIQFPNSKESVSFEKLLSYSLPPSLLNIVLVTIYMQVMFFGLFRPNSSVGQSLAISPAEKDAAKAVNLETLEAMGSMTIGQFFALMLVSFGGLLMMTMKPEFTSGWGEHIDKEVMNPSALAFCTVIMFMLPASINFLLCWNEKSADKTPGLVAWKITDKMVPWELIFVTGMSATFELALKKSKANASLGEIIGDLHDTADPKKPLLFAFFIVLGLTNYVCNWAAISGTAPALMELAVKSKVHPLYYLLPGCLACSLSFLMPTCSMSLSLVKQFANIATGEMMRRGLIPLLISTIVAFGWVFTAGMGVYDVEKSPDWLTPEGAVIVYPDK